MTSTVVERLAARREATARPAAAALPRQLCPPFFHCSYKLELTGSTSHHNVVEACSELMAHRDVERSQSEIKEERRSASAREEGEKEGVEEYSCSDARSVGRTHAA